MTNIKATLKKIVKTQGTASIYKMSTWHWYFIESAIPFSLMYLIKYSNEHHIPSLNYTTECYI